MPDIMQTVEHQVVNHATPVEYVLWVVAMMRSYGESMLCHVTVIRSSAGRNSPTRPLFKSRRLLSRLAVEHVLRRRRLLRRLLHTRFGPTCTHVHSNRDDNRDQEQEKEHNGIV